MISIVKDLKESTALPKEWQGFKPGAWTESIDVRDFIQHNYTPYSGNEEFLSGPSQRTLRLWDELKVLLKREIDNGGVLDADEEVVSSITSHKPGYIDKELEVVVGLQTDAPLKRALMPFGGLRMAQQALESYGFKMCEKTADIFKKIRKTHNEGVFDAYTSDIRAARSAGIITGLGGFAGHSHKYHKRGKSGYMFRLATVQDFSAVTAACLLVRAAVYDDVNGLDENYAVAFNDVDFCLKLRKLGLLNVWTPFAELYHYESISRGLDDQGEKAERYNRESEHFREKWKAELEAGDPYYNPNFSLDRSDYALKDPAVSGR